MLEQAGWESRTPIDEVIFAESWNHKSIDRSHE